MADCGDPEDEMERQLSCSVCLDLFSEPLILPCLHSLCRKCVLKLTTSDGGVASTFKCPECQEDVHLEEKGVSTLKRNFPLLNMVSIYKQGFKKRRLSSASRLYGESSLSSSIPSPTQEKKEVTNISHRGYTAKKTPVCDQSSVELPVNQCAPSLTQNKKNSALASPASVSQSNLNRPQSASSSSHLSPVHDSELFGTGEIPTECSPCDRKPANRAKWHCVVCYMSFCDQCLSEFHPKSGYTADHDVVVLAHDDPVDVQESVLCPLCNSHSPTTRCVQCEMAFCEQCLHTFHPTTESTSDHILEPVEHPFTQEPEGSCPESPLTAPSTGEASGTVEADSGHYEEVDTLFMPHQQPLGVLGGIRKKVASMGLIDGIRQNAASMASLVIRTQRARSEGTEIVTTIPTCPAPPVTASTKAMDMRTLTQAEYLIGQRCSVCSEALRRWATSMCLDCSLYFCDQCVDQHKFPNHSFVDITVPNNAANQRQRRDRFQLKLIELMNVQEQLMKELMEVLEKRRKYIDACCNK